MSDAASPGGIRRVFVWDAPVRVFHWLLLALVVLAWFTGEGEGGAGVIHRYAGEAIAGLLVFRVVWGFIGGEHARFADFAAGPSAIITHVRDLASPSPKRHLGHNPLGGVAVFLLLLNVAVIVVTGLFSGDDLNAGPFAGLWGLELFEAHEAAFRVLQVLVVVHVLGVVVETLRAKDALVPAMITGWKRRTKEESGSDARRAAAGALVAAVLVGAALAAVLMSQPQAAGN
jgi:cytochrome b